MAQLECGKVQIYTGDGKGKTTAALGLSLRARGLGLDVLFLQFAKKLVCAEHEIAPQIGLEIAQATRETPELCAQQILNLAHWALAPAGDAPDASIPIAARNKPVDVLVLDEPTAGLDPAGRDEIFELVRSYHKQSGATILIVSHSMEDIAQVADRLLVMNHAKVLFCDTPREVFSHADEIIAAGLDIPMITKVMLELKKRGHDVDTSVYTVAQAMDALRACKRKEAAHEC